MKFYTPEQIAETLQVHHLTVLKYIKEGILPAIKMGRVYRISEEQLQSFLLALSTWSRNTKQDSESQSEIHQ